MDLDDYIPTEGGGSNWYVRDRAGHKDVWLEHDGKFAVVAELHPPEEDEGPWVLHYPDYAEGGRMWEWTTAYVEDFDDGMYALEHGDCNSYAFHKAIPRRGIEPANLEFIKAGDPDGPR